MFPVEKKGKKDKVGKTKKKKGLEKKKTFNKDGPNRMVELKQKAMEELEKMRPMKSTSKGNDGKKLVKR